MLIVFLLTIIPIVAHAGTTSPVSIILDGFKLETWIEQSTWNKTRISIVHHLNEFCKKDARCNAEYGLDNVHLLNVIQYESSSIYLNITADEPIMNATGMRSLYNYTALLQGALFQAKIDIEHLRDDQLLIPIVYSSIDSDQNSVLHRARRLLYVLLGISSFIIVFALTVLFFQRIRQHRYSKFLKTTQACQRTVEEPLTNGLPISISPG